MPKFAFNSVRARIFAVVVVSVFDVLISRTDLKTPSLEEGSEKEIIKELREVPLLAGLKDKHLQSILRSGKRVEYPEGKVIISDGEVGLGFYLILGGKVSVRRKSKVLARLGKGDFFGEMSLIDRSPRSSDVTADAPTRCLVLSAWAFEGIIGSNKDVAMNMLKTLVRRLRESDKALSD